MADAAAGAKKTWSEQHRRLVTDARYGHVYNNLCERFYSRCDFWLNVLQTGAGSTVLVAAATVLFGDNKGAIPPVLTAITGSALSLLAMAGMFWQPAVRAERHRIASAAFLDLHGRAWSMKTEQLARELADTQKLAPLGPRGLELPAFNRNVVALGFPPEKMTRWERFLDAVS